MLIKKKVLFLLISILIITFALTACYDLGEATEDDEEYCETYPEVRVIKGDASVVYYTMEDFYNEEAVNDFNTVMTEDDRSEYSYLIIEVNKDLSIGEVAVYIDSSVAETVQASFFVLDHADLPTKVYTGPLGRYAWSETNEPSDDKVLAKASVRLSGVPDKWNAIYLRKWGTGEETTKRYSIQEGQYLVVRFDNNRYDPAKREFEIAEEAWQKAKARYEEKLAEWQTVNNNPSSTQEEKDAAMAALRLASSDMSTAEREYEAAQSKYERERFPYQRVPIRVTSILINAE